MAEATIAPRSRPNNAGEEELTNGLVGAHCTYDDRPQDGGK